MTTRLALQGDFASPATLRRDMGNLADAIDGWLDSREPMEVLANQINGCGEVQLLGYSRGGIIITELLVSELLVLSKVRSCVIYEGPNLTREIVPGFFPVCLIWNDQSKPLRWRLRDKTERTWCWQHRVTRLTGHGKHVRRVPGGDPQWGHNWDWGLNDRIANFLGDT